MANICSVYVQIFPKQRLHLCSDNFKCSQVITSLLSGFWGSSYNTPIFSQYGLYGRYLEVAHGEKWGPGSVDEFFEDNEAEIDAIFCRYYDEGGDYDFIYHLSHNQALCSSFPHKIPRNRKCRYGFDQIKFQSKSPIKHEQIKHLIDNWYVLDLKGSYLSESNYCDLFGANKFNQIKIDDEVHTLIDEFERKLISEDNRIVETIEANASVMEYYFRQKLVTYAVNRDYYYRRGLLKQHIWKRTREEQHLLFFPFDSWHNCVDEAYLEYITQINPPKPPD